MAAFLKSKMAADKRKSQPGKLRIMILEIRSNILIPLASFYPKCLAEPLFWISAPWLWANAQRTGLPAEYKWRPLFNAAKFGWRPLLECRALTLPRRKTRWNFVSDIAIFVLKRDVKLQLTNLLKFAGVPQTPKRISAVSGPQFTILGWRVWEIYCCFTSFPDCRYMTYLRRYSPTKSCYGAQMANFLAIFGSCISSEQHAARFTPAF